MHFHNRLADRQPQSQSFTSRPNLHKGVKNFLELFWFDSNARVADLDFQRLGFGVEACFLDSIERRR
jgi:hypothetical protein